MHLLTDFLLFQIIVLRIQITGNVATCFEKQGKYKEAKDACTAVISMQPDNLKALLRAARAATHQDMYDEASLCLQVANEYYPKNTEVQREVRNLKHKVEKYKIARKNQFGGVLLGKSGTEISTKTSTKAEIVAGSLKESRTGISTQEPLKHDLHKECNPVIANVFWNIFSRRGMLSVVVLLLPTILMLVYSNTHLKSIFDI